MTLRHLLRAPTLIGATGVCVALGACAGPGKTARDQSAPAPTTAVAAPAERPVSGSIEVYDQTSDGTTLIVERATIDGTAGWIIVHLDEGGPGEVISCTAIPQGSSTDVAVRLATKVGTGPVWPMLHRDAGQVGVCEWPGGPDGPVRPPSGAITYATRKIILTVS